jgi:ATP-dependent protease HslVU (ClpYQ) peptidase subunit
MICLLAGFVLPYIYTYRMTTIIAIQHEDWCLIAADSQTTGYELAGDCSSMGKIALNGDYLVSAAGLVRGMNLIQHALLPPKAPKVKDLNKLDKFIVNQFVPKLRQTFIKSGYDMKDDGDIAQHDNDFIIAVNGIIYFLDESYAIERMNDKLYATGTGMKLALGAAYALGIQDCDDYDEAIDILERAVKAAIRYDIYSGGRIQVALQTKDGSTFMTTLDE